MGSIVKNNELLIAHLATIGNRTRVLGPSRSSISLNTWKEGMRYAVPHSEYPETT